jgi:hypothetical protein
VLAIGDSPVPKADKRSEGRSNVFLTATLHSGASPSPVRIRNLSARGALIEAAKLPPPGSAVRLVRGQLFASGELAWASGGHGGVRFTSEIDVDSWVKKVGHGEQQRVDGVVAALRSSGTVPPTLQKVDGGDTIDAVSGDLDRLCEQLVGNANLSLELGEQLLKLDAIAQRLRRLATGKAY